MIESDLLVCLRQEVDAYTCTTLELKSHQCPFVHCPECFIIGVIWSIILSDKCFKIYNKEKDPNLKREVRESWRHKLTKPASFTFPHYCPVLLFLSKHDRVYFIVSLCCILLQLHQGEQDKWNKPLFKCCHLQNKSSLWRWPISSTWPTDQPTFILKTLRKVLYKCQVPFTCIL